MASSPEWQKTSRGLLVVPPVEKIEFSIRFVNVLAIAAPGGRQPTLNHLPAVHDQHLAGDIRAAGTGQIQRAWAMSSGYRRCSRDFPNNSFRILADGPPSCRVMKSGAAPLTVDATRRQ